jgi:hypothetical protein
MQVFTFYGSKGMPQQAVDVIDQAAGSEGQVQRNYSMHDRWRQAR